MMKDKLYKTGHKFGYYLTRKIVFSFGVFVSLGALVAIPTYITVTANANDVGNAQQEEVENNKTPETENSYISY